MWSSTEDWRAAASHSGQGQLPLPWWLMTLLSICNPLTAFPLMSRVASHNLAQPTRLATSAITGAFTQHLSTNICLSSRQIVSFISLAAAALPLRIAHAHTWPHVRSPINSEPWCVPVQPGPGSVIVQEIVTQLQREQDELHSVNYDSCLWHTQARTCMASRASPRTMSDMT